MGKIPARIDYAKVSAYMAEIRRMLDLLSDEMDKGCLDAEPEEDQGMPEGVKKAGY